MTVKTFSLAALGAMVLVLGGCPSQQKCPVCPRVRTVAPPPRSNAPRTVVITQGHKRPSCERLIKTISRQAKAHLHIKELLGWYTRTRGEKSMQAELFVGREHLFSRRHLAYLKDCIAAIKDVEEKRAVSYLRDFVAVEYVNRKTAPLKDAVSAAEIKARASLSWVKGPVAYRDLPKLLSQEKNAGRRAQISAAMTQVRRKTLNPLLERLMGKTHEMAQWMGYRSYAQLGIQTRQVDLAKLIKAGDAFVQSTESLHKGLLARVVKSSMGVDLKRFKRADHYRVIRAPKVEKHLPKALMIPAFKHFLRGIGLDMKTAAGTEIMVDASMHAKKNPRAACFPLDTPRDVRITVKPVGGMSSWATFFHEGGHALHFAWTTTKRFEYQQLGNYSATEAWAELFARAWEDQHWLKRYGKFVGEVNRGKHKDLLGQGVRVRRVPVMSKKQMGYLIRHRLSYNLYLARRYGWAKLIYEAVLHGGQASLWNTVYKGSTADRRKLYQELFARAYGYALGEEDADRYLTDVDAFFYAADYARAFMLADMLHEHLRGKFGADWYGKREVGAYLKTLWADGNKWSAEEVARKIGYKSFDYAASLARLKRLLGEADTLSGKKTKIARRHPAGCKRAKVAARKPVHKCAIPK